jgi:putative ABC transport system permease protein
LDEFITASTVMQRFRMVLLGFFALLAFVLAILGIFGVMSFSVSQRTQEMAVRIAIGAQRSSVIWLVVRQGMSVAAIGLAGGILGALGLTRFLSSFLYDVMINGQNSRPFQAGRNPSAAQTKKSSE